MGKEQGDLSHVIHRHWRGTSEITTSSLGLKDSRADKKHQWSDKLHILCGKTWFGFIIHTIVTSFEIENYYFFLLLTFESPWIFKTFTCFYPSLATINRTVDSSLGFDWLSNWWEILDINRAFSASPSGNALFFQTRTSCAETKRWRYYKRRVCLYGFIGTDLYHATNGKMQNPNFIEAWVSHSQPPRATIKGAGMQAWPRLGSVKAWRWIWIVNFALTSYKPSMLSYLRSRGT